MRRPALTPEARLAATAWLAAARDHKQQRAAELCLGQGIGHWYALPTDVAAPYIMDNATKRKGMRGTKWIGRCDADLNGENSSRPARPAVRFRWQPEGKGCAALLKNNTVLPDQATLAHAFCSRWAGRSVLFVGDSVQAAAFHSFAHIVDGRYVPSPLNENAPCNALADGSGYDADLTAELCVDNAPDRRVHARYIRNELLWLNRSRNAAGRAQADHTRMKNVPARFLCDWDTAAAEADILVINRGYHSTNVDVAVRRDDLNATLHALGALIHHPALSRTHDHEHVTRGHEPTRLVYRGTHASIYRCASYSDPLTPPASAGVHEVTHAYHLHRSNANAWYGWRNVYAHARLDQTQVAGMGDRLRMAYVDTYLQTSLRPGGRLDPNDCNHFCLPGPPDEWTTLLLALLT